MLARMATKTIVQYFSDLTGEVIDGDSATVSFGLDGYRYEIDLTLAEQQYLRELLAPYIAAGRAVRGERRGRASAAQTSSGGPSPKVVRAWAKENGHPVPDRGRIPAPIFEAYLAAH